MNIANLRIRITIQKLIETEDEIGNSIASWTDYFTCWASAAAGRESEETEEATTPVDRERVDFTVRYSKETASVTAKEHRIVFGDRVYDILVVDDMGFRHKSLKFQTERRIR